MLPEVEGSTGTMFILEPQTLFRIIVRRRVIIQPAVPAEQVEIKPQVGVPVQETQRVEIEPGSQEGRVEVRGDQRANSHEGSRLAAVTGISANFKELQDAVTGLGPPVSISEFHSIPFDCQSRIRIESHLNVPAAFQALIACGAAILFLKQPLCKILIYRFFSTRRIAFRKIKLVRNRRDHGEEAHLVEVGGLE